MSKLSKVKKAIIVLIDEIKRPKIVKEYIRDNECPVTRTGMFEKKVVLVTGASSGIGYAAARQYLLSGAKVIITGRNSDKLNAAYESLKKIGEVKQLEWDIEDCRLIDSKVNEANSLFGSIDILVNNAGVNKKRSGENFNGWKTVTFDDWDYVLDINLKATYFIIQAMANMWISQGCQVDFCKKHIVNVVSGSAHKPAIAPYGISKWGVRGLTEGFGKKLAPYNIIVNGISPGPSCTDMGNMSDSEVRLSNTSIPTGRMSTPDEIANSILYLSSEYCDSVVGEVLRKDGGFSLTTMGEC